VFRREIAAIRYMPYGTAAAYAEGEYTFQPIKKGGGRCSRAIDFRFLDIFLRFGKARLARYTMTLKLGSRFY